MLKNTFRIILVLYKDNAWEKWDSTIYFFLNHAIAQLRSLLHIVQATMPEKKKGTMLSLTLKVKYLLSIKEVLYQLNIKIYFQLFYPWSKSKLAFGLINFLPSFLLCHWLLIISTRQPITKQ